jgi:hypothetical protein
VLRDPGLLSLCLVLARAGVAGSAAAAASWPLDELLAWSVHLEHDLSES